MRWPTSWPRGWSTSRPQFLGPRFLGPEAALATGVRSQRAQEVDAPEVGPVGVVEIELRVRRLPQQEARQPLFAARPDDQVGIGLTARVEVLGDVLDVEDLGQLLDRAAGRRVLVQQRPYGIGDLPPSAVADRHVDLDATVAVLS